LRIAVLLLLEGLLLDVFAVFLPYGGFF